MQPATHAVQGCSLGRDTAGFEFFIFSAPFTFPRQGLEPGKGEARGWDTEDRFSLGTVRRWQGDGPA